MAEREGWTVLGEFTDEAFSAYHGRGPGLEQAKALAVAAAAEHGRCVLVAQDADRFARGAGDAPGAADHLGEVYFALKRQRVELWTVRSGHLDLLRAAIEGERSTDESQRKSQSVTAGLMRRKEGGAPVGPIPLGYTVEDPDAKITRRIIDPATKPTVERIYAMVEAGASFGDVVRTLNAEGIKTRRGSTFISRRVREIVHNEAYAGAKGYPAIIDPERWRAIQAGLRRLDPAAVQRRKGGRKPNDTSYWLRGTVFCLACGAALYTRKLAAGRHYICANARQATGLCDAPSILAELIEGHVLDHIEGFVGDARTWLAEQAAEHDAGRQELAQATERLRDDLARIERRRDLILADYERAIAEDDPTARIVLEVVAKLDSERQAMTAKIADAEAVAAEWKDTDDSGLSDSVDLLRALGQADTADALNASMSQAVTGIYAAVTDGRLRAEFELADGRPSKERFVYLLRHVEPANLAADRVTFGETVRQTFV
jgi:DNA invertase Pin-like site-specific DNA recombinase